MLKHLAALVAVATSASALAAPTPLQQRATALLVAEVPPDGPGVSAVISREGKIAWSGAVGRASLSDSRPLQPDDVFRYASITKQFTAALVLKLVDEGKLSLDDNLGNLLPTATPTAWHDVTIRQLLNHTSGIPSYTAKPFFMIEARTSQPITTQQLIDATRDQPLDFPPGTRFRYNNSGYVLLSAVVERVTGKPWYAALRDKITGPLGLKSIRCGCEPGAPTVDGFNGPGKAAQKIDMSFPSGAGALVGTAADLARWAAALHGGKVLSPASYAAMTSPMLPAGATERYGFGLSLGEVRGQGTIGHNGGIFGFSTESLYVPSSKLFVAVLGNSDSGPVDSGILARRLVAEALGQPLPRLVAQPVAFDAVTPWLGIYRDDKGERRFFAREGKLFTQRPDGPANEVLSAGNGRFFYGPRSLSYFDMANGADGKPRILFYSNGAVEPQVGNWAGPLSVEESKPS